MDRRPDIVAAVGRMTSPDEVRREIQHLPAYLRDGEFVQRLAAGVYGVGTGLMAVTDRRVVVLREGRSGQASEGFPLEQLSGLDWAATTAEHATITIRDTTRTTEFTQVAPTDAAELVGFVRALLRPPATPQAAPPPGSPPRGASAGGSIGHKFDGPPAAVTPGAAAEHTPPSGYDAGAPGAGVESTAGVRGERWPLGEVPVRQLIGTPPEAADPAAGAPVPGGAVEGRPVGEPVAPAGQAVTSARTSASAQAGAAVTRSAPTEAVPSAAANAPEAPRATGPRDQSDSAARSAAGETAAEQAEPKPGRRPRFWQRSRARAADKSSPPAGA